MKSRVATDPTSWAYQASIHGSYDDPAAPGGTRHGGFFFLSWHRMYLYWFEHPARYQRGGVDQALSILLPYWNYETQADGLAQRISGPRR